MRRGVLWDSSAILALIDADDRDHVHAAEITRSIARQGQPSFVTNDAEVETHALLLARLGRALAREWLLSAGLPVIRVAPAEEAHAKEILLRCSDKDSSVCDALSFSVMERRSVRTAFSFDRHFRQYGRFEILGS